MRLQSILKESTTKGREYNHLEDLVFFEGSAGAFQAAQLLTRLGQDTGDVSIKWDGSPTIFWGRQPNGTFVLVGKNGWGKRMSTTPEDLSDYILNTGNGEEWRKQFAAGMSSLFAILEDSTPADMRGYVYGDLLYHPGKPAVRDNNNIQFTPNNVTYTVDRQSPIGQRMDKSSVCVVVHTYHDAFGDKHGTPVKEPKQLNSELVVVLGQTYVTQTPKIDTSTVQNIVSTARNNSNTIDNWLSPEQGLSRKDQIVYTYVNQMTKQGKLDQIRTGFFDWLKQSKVSPGQQTKLMANDSRGLDVILDLVAQIQAAKNDIIDQLDAGSTDVKAVTGDKSGGEGYVVTRDKIKLVPRHRWTPVQVG
jgi:hypothetical protein